MMEIKVTVILPGIPEALNNLADAINTRATLMESDEPIIIGKVNERALSDALNKAEVAPTVPTVPAAPTTPVSPEVQTATPAPIQPAPVAPAAPILNPAITSAPTRVKKYTREDIAKAGNALVTTGKMQDLLNLLKKYNVQSLTKLAEEQLPAFAEDMKALGADL